MEAKEEDVSSLDRLPKFRGAADSRLASLKNPLWRPEYERGVRSSGVALPRETRCGDGVMNPFPFPFAWYPLTFPLKLLVLLGLGFDPYIVSFSLRRRSCSFFLSWNNRKCNSKNTEIARVGQLVAIEDTRYRFLSSSCCCLVSLYSSKIDTKRTWRKTVDYSQVQDDTRNERKNPKRLAHPIIQERPVPFVLPSKCLTYEVVYHTWGKKFKR